MNKKEFFEQKSKTTNLKIEELEDIYRILEKQYEKDKGTKPTELWVLNRMLVFLTRRERKVANLIEHQGIFLGIADNFNFNKNVDIVKMDAIKQYQENPEQALEMKIVVEKTDKVGKKHIIPCWHYVDGINVFDNQIGKEITPDAYSARAFFIVVNNEKQLLQEFRVRGQRKDYLFSNYGILNGREVKFKMGEFNGKPFDNEQTQFEVVNNKTKEIPKILAKIAKDNLLNLKNIEEFYLKNNDKIMNMPVFVRGQITNYIISQTRDNDIAIFTDVGYKYGTFPIYVPKSLGTPNQQVSDIIFGGMIRKSDKRPDSPFGMNAFGFFELTNEEIIIPQELSKYGIIEEVITDTTKSKELMKEVTDEEW